MPRGVNGSVQVAQRALPNGKRRVWAHFGSANGVWAGMRALWVRIWIVNNLLPYMVAFRFTPHRILGLTFRPCI